MSAVHERRLRFLAEGGSTPATIDGPQMRDMPSFAGKLTDAEMAHVLTFVRNA